MEYGDLFMVGTMIVNAIATEYLSIQYVFIEMPRKYIYNHPQIYTTYVYVLVYMYMHYI